MVSSILKQTCCFLTLKCKRNTDNKDAKMLKTKNGKLMLSSKCAVCGGKKSTFMEEQEAEGSLSNLGIKAPLSEIPLLNVLSTLINLHIK